MGAVRGSGNRTTELRLKMALVRSGVRGWTANRSDLPGKPDFYFESARLAVFVDGCFWHGCGKCGHIPKTHQEFWATKIERNRNRHKKVSKLLKIERIRLLRFWEHQLRDDLHRCVRQIVMRLPSK
ncbi:DNA mismatch endonuclease vsr [Terriglobus saanensis SP1PR4]|uniref:DNA mismatch endonuclease vsr n=2 Tax=Terriglobus saanensis TaxID=870903 RepID=E8V5B0_TERSS|nr:DNA mismatch endonuclease vsr [Terriglobus saanensis SP1PR4]